MATYIVISYMVIGIILSLIWWHVQFATEYERLRKEGEVQSGTGELMILMMIVLWPFKLVYNLYLYYFKHAKTKVS